MILILTYVAKFCHARFIQFKLLAIMYFVRVILVVVAVLLVLFIVWGLKNLGNKN